MKEYLKFVGCFDALVLWANPLTVPRVPKLLNLLTDPYERADITFNTYYDWLLDHVGILAVPAQAITGQFLSTFKEFPPSQKAGSFSLGDALDKLRDGKKGSKVTLRL